MAKPRVFVSSTYYDLKYIRKNLEAFIEGLGYEPVLFESGDVPFQPNEPLDDSCYKEVTSCHILVLVIGGKYGSATSASGDQRERTHDKMYGFYNSITSQEYRTACDKGIPTFVFVDKAVYAEYQTFKRNRNKTDIAYASVDNVGVFKLLDEMVNKRVGNFVRPFENFDDISSWLRDQWAGLFALYLEQVSSQAEFSTLAGQVAELASVSKTLTEYSESIMRAVQPKQAARIIRLERNRATVTKARRLNDEEMIRHLRSWGGMQSSEISVLEALCAADGLEDFLGRIGLDQKKLKEFVEQNGPLARRHYERFKSVYVEDFRQDPKTPAKSKK